MTKEFNEFNSFGVSLVGKSPVIFCGQPTIGFHPFHELYEWNSPIGTPVLIR